MRGLVDEMRAGREGVVDTVWGVEPDAFGIKANPPTVSIDVRPVIGRKLRALHCHRSQLPPSNALAWLTEAQAARWLGTEFFHLVEGSPATSVLDGLAVTATAYPAPGSVARRHPSADPLSPA